MSKDLSKLIWPLTALACAAMIGAGAHFGLRGNRQPRRTVLGCFWSLSGRWGGDRIAGYG